MNCCWGWTLSVELSDHLSGYIMCDWCEEWQGLTLESRLSSSLGTRPSVVNVHACITLGLFYKGDVHGSLIVHAYKCLWPPCTLCLYRTYTKYSVLMNVSSCLYTVSVCMYAVNNHIILKFRISISKSALESGNWNLEILQKSLKSCEILKSAWNLEILSEIPRFRNLVHNFFQWSTPRHRLRVCIFFFELSIPLAFRWYGVFFVCFFGADRQTRLINLATSCACARVTTRSWLFVYHLASQSPPIAPAGILCTTDSRVTYSNSKPS